VRQRRLSPLIVLASLCGAMACSSSREPVDDAARPAEGVPTSQAAGFVNKIWRVTEPDAAPGSLYIFLADGSLVQTSCVEVYRLSAWRRETSGALTITEDLSVRYEAEAESVGDRQLRLRFKLGGSWTPWKTLELARPPFVCPDLRK
jgi:hypothetical protein